MAASRCLVSPWRRVPRTWVGGVLRKAWFSTNDLPAVFDLDAGDLEDVLMVKSFGVPTILDCYADWCQPCKKLTPILEEKVNNAKGRLRLAKFEIDRNEDHKQWAARLGVQSIPAVFGIAQGKMVDQFNGLVPDERIQEFIDKLLAVDLSGSGQSHPDTQVDDNDPKALQAAGQQALRTGNFTDALKRFQAVLDMESRAANNKKADIKAKKKVDIEVKDELEEQAAIAFAGIAQVHLAQGEEDAAQKVVSEMKSKSKWRKYDTVRQISQAWAAVELFTDAASKPGTVASLEAHLAQNADDLEARYSLAITLVAENSLQRAIDEALQIIRRERNWEDGKAKNMLLNVFALLGNDHPDTKEGRKRLSNYLF